MLAQAEKVISAAHSHGEVPFSFDFETAMVLAAGGKTASALASLERARSRGWVNTGWGDLLNLRDEPAFASLRGNPRFEAVCRELDALYARERRAFLAARP